MLWSDHEFRVGDVVRFYDKGRTDFVLAAVVSIGRSRYGIRLLESLTIRRVYEAGTEFRCTAGLLQEATEAERERGKELAQALRTSGSRAADFSVGQRVKFDARGRQVSGTVIRVNRKTCSVHVDGDSNHRHWTVPPHMLMGA